MTTSTATIEVSQVLPPADTLMMAIGNAVPPTTQMTWGDATNVTSGDTTQVLWSA